MFCKLALLAFVAPLVSALTLQIPENPTSGGTITIKWVSAPNDPDTWSFELINTAFNNAFAISNNVDPAPQQLTLTLPVIPEGPGYTLQAVDIGDINKIFATTGSFSVGASSFSTTPQSTVSGKTSLSGSQTSSTPALTRSTASTSAASNIVTSSPAPSATSPAPTPTPTPSTGAALSARVAAPAVILLSGLAGAAMIAL